MQLFVADPRRCFGIACGTAPRSALGALRDLGQSIVGTPLKREHKFIEVIILTGHGSLESAVECTKLGAFGDLPKPYEMDKLLDTLKQAYEARMRKKFDADQERLVKILAAALGESPVGILRRLRDLDDEVK